MKRLSNFLYLISNYCRRERPYVRNVNDFHEFHYVVRLQTVLLHSLTSLNVCLLFISLH